MFLLLGLPRAIAVALISQTNLRSSFSVLQVLPYIIYFCRYCAWTWQKKARSDQIDHCPQLTQIQEILWRSALFYFILSCWTAETSGQVEIMTSQPTGGQTPKWLQIFHMSLLVTIAKTRSRKFEGVTLSGSLTRFRFPLDQTLLIWQCFGEYLQPWTSNISKYLKICIFVQIVEIAQYLDGCLSKHVKWVDQSEEPALFWQIYVTLAIFKVLGNYYMKRVFVSKVLLVNVCVCALWVMLFLEHNRSLF